MKRAVVVGSGAGGAVAARLLQGKFSVTVLEAGGEFRPLSMSLGTAEKLKRLGLLFDEREIRPIFPPMRIMKARDGLVLVRGVGTGGTTTISTGNALRADGDLREMGIDLGPEFAGLEQDIPIHTGHRARWKESTRELYEAFKGLGLEPRPTPKMGNGEKCAACGRCILGCPTGAKWDSRRFLEEAVKAGAELRTGTAAIKVVVRKGKAEGLVVKSGLLRRLVPADLIILAAGGMGTPAILERSGIRCEPRLFVDPVLCVAAERPGALQDREMPMPFIVQGERFILSPYFDFLSYFFNRGWKSRPGDILSLMIKLADEDAGSVSAWRVRKSLTPSDKARLEEAAGLCAAALGRLGIGREKIFFGTPNAGHPGGSLPLTEAESRTLHSPRLPENVYIADATLLPRSLGNPPILTIMALAGRVGRLAAEKFA